MAKGFRTGGRVKGTPNKATVMTEATIMAREMLVENMLKEISNLPQWIKDIENPEAKVQALVRCLPFVLPRVSNIGFGQPADGTNGDQKVTMILD